MLPTDSVIPYRVTVKTGDVKMAGTDANVFLTIIGDKANTGKQKLANSETNGDPFEQGCTDIFVIESPDIGKVRYISV